MDGEMDMSHGDADTIPEDLEDDYFPPNFKEYMLKEKLKWSRYTNQCSTIGWAFWSQHDHKITRALQKLISDYYSRNWGLVQFWAATKTLEGRTRLTTQFQPFALGPTWSTIQRQRLCEYRMKMCSSEYNNCFYADVESGEEQLGLPGRVFRNQFPEVTPNVKYYSTKEYPQRDLALRCKIARSWAVPVFEHSSRTCVGVLEMANAWSVGYDDWQTTFFLINANKIFQEHGLQCFDGRQACEAQLSRREIRVKGLTQAFKELKTVLRSVCESHKLPLAMTWVPCSNCNGLGRCKFYSWGVEFCLQGDPFLCELLNAGKCMHLRKGLVAERARSSLDMHLRKGLVAERARSSLDMLYCSDITQLSIHDYPLVHYARWCILSGWLTINLLCKHTGNFIYVIEFFLSDRSKDDEKTTLSLILGTIEEKFTTFRFASGKELGELIPVEVIHFQENQKIHSLSSIQATREFSMSSIPSSVQSSASVANIRPGSQDACMGTINAKCDSDSNLSSDSDHSFEQSTTSVPMVTVKAKYAGYTIRFMLSLPCRLEELQEEVAKRLELLTGTYQTFYKDVSGELILIDCDKDLQACVETSISLGNTSIVVFLEPK